MIADHEPSVESGELTPSMKVKRSAIEANFAAEIATMYPIEESARHGDAGEDAELSDADMLGRAAVMTGSRGSSR